MKLRIVCKNHRQFLNHRIAVKGRENLVKEGFRERLQSYICMELVSSITFAKLLSKLVFF